MTGKQKKHIRILGLVLFILYLIMLIYFLFFAESLGRKLASDEMRYNLVPFKEIRRFWNNRQLLGGQAAFLNIFGNIAGFIPFGAILPLIAPGIGMRLHFIQTVCTGFIFSLLVELTQLLTRTGSFDVDDLLLNTAGAAAGYILFALACRLVRRKTKE